MEEFFWPSIGLPGRLPKSFRETDCRPGGDEKMFKMLSWLEMCSRFV